MASSAQVNSWTGWLSERALVLDIEGKRRLQLCDGLRSRLYFYDFPRFPHWVLSRQVCRATQRREELNPVIGDRYWDFNHGDDLDDHKIAQMGQEARDGP